ncbi:hypothetical protein V2J09_014568, partial [Rumex salicifolius]
VTAPSKNRTEEAINSKVSSYRNRLNLLFCTRSRRLIVSDSKMPRSYRNRIPRFAESVCD